jgi:hypothetical protein
MTKLFLKLVLAMLVVVIALTSADARWRGYYRHGFYARQDNGEERDRRSETERQPAQMQQMQRSPAVSFGAIMSEITRGCSQQAADFKAWPFERIAEVANPDAEQRRSLDALRDAALASADTLAADCPPATPSPPASGRREDAEAKEATPRAPALQLDAAERAIEAVTAGLAAVQPAVRDFYTTLDDEQKAQLYRRLPSRDADQVTSARQRSPATADNAGVPWNGLCERLILALRDWPTKGIELAMRLTNAQRVALYELYATVLKTADTLAATCPAETALTPARRMEVLRTRLIAVRAATTAIGPSLMHFHDALDGAQQQRFAQMN